MPRNASWLTSGFALGWFSQLGVKPLCRFGYAGHVHFFLYSGERCGGCFMTCAFLHVHSLFKAKARAPDFRLSYSANPARQTPADCRISFILYDKCIRQFSIAHSFGQDSTQPVGNPLADFQVGGQHGEFSQGVDGAGDADAGNREERIDTSHDTLFVSGFLAGASGSMCAPQCVPGPSQMRQLSGCGCGRRLRSAGSVG